MARALREDAAFHAAEAGWLGALAAWSALCGEPETGDRAIEAGASRAERAAARAFALVPSPSLHSLPRKLCLIGREAHEVAHSGACGKELAVWLSALCLDLTRLLAEVDPASVSRAEADEGAADPAPAAEQAI